MCSRKREMSRRWLQPSSVAMAPMDARPRVALRWCHDHSIPGCIRGESACRLSRNASTRSESRRPAGRVTHAFLELSRLRNEGFELDRPVRQLGHRHRADGERRAASGEARYTPRWLRRARWTALFPRPATNDSIPRPSISQAGPRLKINGIPGNGTSRSSVATPRVCRQPSMERKRHERSSGGRIAPRRSSQSAVSPS